MIETGGGMPSEGFHTDALGTPQADGSLEMQQTIVFDNGTVQQRDWHFIRLNDHEYQGTANGVIGTAYGEAYGNALHWQYVLALDQGNSLKHVDAEQWLYLQDDGTVINREALRKAGLTVAMVTESFRHLR